MNIEVQCCGLVLMLIIFISNVLMRKGRPLIYTSKLFVAALSVSIIAICFDILSMVALYYIDVIPEWLTEMACKAYIVCLVYEATSALVYSLYDCFSYRRYRRFAYICLAVDIVVSVLIAVLPIEFNVSDPSHAFTEGAAVLLTYAACLMALFTTMIILIFFGKRMNKQRHSAVVLWVSSWVVAALIQFFNNKLLLIGFATAIGMTVLFAVLENPTAGIDRVTGTFNLPMLHDYMSQEFNRGKRFSLVSISFQAHAGLIESDDEIRSSLVKYFDEVAHNLVFRNTRAGFVLVYKYGTEDISSIVNKLKYDFSSDWVYGEKNEKSHLLNPSFLVMEDSEELGSPASIFALANYAFNTSVDSSGAVIYLDDSKVKEAQEFEKTKKEIISAMKQDRVVVFFQPIWSVKDKKFVSAEALVRIRKNDGTIIPPGVFIPVAEETGHILELGHIVFEKVCKFIRDKEPKKLGIEYIEVNLSVKQCEQRELSNLYQGIIQKFGVDPKYINLEITESSSIEIRQNVLDNMNELIRFGIEFSLDDFGNGQSNLDYIIDMPVAIVKFDRQMTQSYFTNERARLVMQSIVKMVHEMKLRIVAEGVEHKEELEELERIGVEYIQGFYFSKPIPEAEFLQYIKKHNLGE